MVGIELFGTLSLRGRDGTAVHVAGRCGRLLGYLALHRGRCVGRAELLENVWAEAGDHTNAGTFNTALWRLRRQLRAAGAKPDAILACDASGVVFDPAYATHVDVLDFECAALPSLQVSLDGFDEPDAARLRAAVVLHRADLMPDFSDDWVLRERERLRRMLLSAYARLAEHAMRTGHAQEAIGHAQSILDREPLREDVHCLLMRAFVASGQRALALRQFERCRALLRTELAIAPMDDTLALYREIAESALPGGTAPAVQRAAAPAFARVAGPRMRCATGEARAGYDAGGLLHPSPHGRRSTDAGAGRDAGDRRMRPRGRGDDAPDIARLALEQARRCMGDADRHLREGLAAIAR